MKILKFSKKQISSFLLKFIAMFVIVSTSNVSDMSVSKACLFFVAIAVWTVSAQLSNEKIERPTISVSVTEINNKEVN